MLEDAFKEVAGKSARSVIAQDARSARTCLAPWLEKDFSPARPKSIIEPRYEDMLAPAEFTLDGNSCTLADLEPTDLGPEQDTGFDACLDLWMAVVDVGGEMKIGYYEATDPD